MKRKPYRRKNWIEREWQKVKHTINRADTTTVLFSVFALLIAYFMTIDKVLNFVNKILNYF